MTYEDDKKVDGISLVTEDAKEYLNPKQEITYRAQFESRASED